MKLATRVIASLFFSMFCSSALAQATDDDARLRSINELRHSIGLWDVQTEYLNEDGSVAKAVSGTYEFSWIVEDCVVSGKSNIPELEMASGILLYVHEKDKTIEMVSVGKDGRLWIMTGPLGSDTRTTREFDTEDGGKSQLRFIRFNVEEASFESRMEYTTDGGKTWKPGNHQVFKKANKAKIKE